MKKVLVPVLFLSLLLNAVLLLRRPEAPAPSVVRTRVVEQRVEPEPAPAPQPRPIPEQTAISAAEPNPASAEATAGGPAPTRAERPSVALLATPTYASPHGRITVTCSVLSGNSSSRDWIGLYVVGTDVSRYSAYLMVHPGAEYVFKAPRAPGEYEFRYVLDDNKTAIASSNPLRVLDDPVARTLVDVQSGTSYVKCGGEIPVSWSLLSGRRSPQDWIGLYAPGAKNEDFVAWKYVTDADQGRLTLQAPAQPGTYEMRYLLDNGYESVATSIRIVVLP